MNETPNPEETDTTSNDNGLTWASAAFAMLMVLAAMPVVGTLAAILTASSAEESQYSILVFIGMAIYNIPALSITSIAFGLGYRFDTHEKSQAAIIAYGIAIITSVIGIGMQTYMILSNTVT